MNCRKHQLFAIILLVSLTLFILCTQIICSKQNIFGFEQIQCAAQDYMKTELGTDYSKYGYCTLFVDDDYSLSSLAISFVYRNNYVYEVYFDQNGEIKRGSLIPLGDDASYYETYQNIRGVYVIKGLYGSYLLTEDDSIIYTGGIKFDDLPSSDLVDSSIFNHEFVMREYDIDITKFYNCYITQKNNEK